MVITCGVVIKVGSEFLVEHPTGSAWKRKWSIPKGCMDQGEDYYTTAIRETFEETGIVLFKNQLKFLGKTSYRAGKDIVLFETELQNKPESLKCTSFLLNGSPEVDKFAWITYEKAEAYLNKNLFRVFSQYIKEF